MKVLKRLSPPFEPEVLSNSISTQDVEGICEDILYTTLVTLSPTFHRTLL